MVQAGLNDHGRLKNLTALGDNDRLFDAIGTNRIN